MLESKMDNATRELFLEKLLNQMTLNQKVGQCFTIHWGGSIITPYLVEAIEKLQIGGLRVTPFGQNSRRGKHYHQSLKYNYEYPKGYQVCKQNLFIPGPAPYISPEQYAQRINQLQKIAVARHPGIPLHIAVDQEGDISRDFCYGGMHLFPSAMGLTATGDPRIVYEASKAIATQLRAVGITMIHSPVLDVNINPNNPEICHRAYSDDPQTVAEYALASFNGFRDGGLVATAKHFPGRGNSDQDAHYTIPVVQGDLRQLQETELYPYQVLIENGLECIMIAHTAVPCLDPGHEIATTSRPIITGFLRDKLGYQGVITTDSITMGALMEKYGVGKACAMAVKAGCDLALNKTEDEFRDQGFCELKRFVEEGLIPLAELDASVKRILRMKYNQGLFDSMGLVKAETASDPICDREVINISRIAAQKCVMILRDEEKLLPLRQDQTIMVIEQKILAGYAGNDAYCHDKAFNEAMYKYSMNIIGLDTEFKATEDDENFLSQFVDAVEIIVVTNFYWRLCPNNNTALIRRLLQKGKQVIVVTNVPYPMGAVPEAKTVICNFAVTPESDRATAAVLFGKEKAEGQWPLKHYPLPSTSTPLNKDQSDAAKENEIKGVVF